MRAWSFDVPPNAAVVTTTYVTRERLPILLVSHEADEDGGISWQFHCGNGDYSPSALQLVGLETILQLDPRLVEIAALPVGYVATRASLGGEWVVRKDEPELEA